MQVVVRKPAFSTLAEFSSGGRGSHAQPSAAEIEAHAAERITAASDEAFQRGFSAGQEEAHRDFEKRALTLRAQFDERLADERASLGVQQADALAAQLDAGLRNLALKIETDVSALLTPWLKNQMREQALGLFYAAVNKAASGSAKIIVEGPEAFLDQFKTNLAGRDVHAVTTNGDAAGIFVTIDETAIDLNLISWMASWEKSGP